MADIFSLREITECNQFCKDRLNGLDNFQSNFGWTVRYKQGVWWLADGDHTFAQIGTAPSQVKEMLNKIAGLFEDNPHIHYFPWQ